MCAIKSDSKIEWGKRAPNAWECCAKVSHTAERERERGKSALDEINSYIIGILLSIHIICWFWCLCVAPSATWFSIFLVVFFSLLFAFLFLCCPCMWSYTTRARASTYREPSEIFQWTEDIDLFDSGPFFDRPILILLFCFAHLSGFVSCFLQVLY